MEAALVDLEAATQLTSSVNPLIKCCREKQLENAC